LASIVQPQTNIDQLVERGVSNVLYVSQIFEKVTPEQKKSVVGSMYPENLTFDGFLVRTARVNEAARLIYELGVGFSENKKDKAGINPFCPGR
jgi:site-specific DNA recombinase